jgi:hypothetical protein
MKSLSFVLAFVSVSACAAAACSSSSTSTSDNDGGTPTGTDGSTTSDATSTDGSATDAGNPLVPSGVTKIVFTSKGGGPLPPPPDGSVCQEVDITYTITLPARDFSWKICETADGPNSYRTGQRTLTAEQYKTVDDKLQALKRQTMTQCGADKPEEAITFTSASGDVTYYDDFYFCDASDPKIYVSGMEDVFTAMTLLVQ